MKTKDLTSQPTRTHNAGDKLLTKVEAHKLVKFIFP